MIMLVPILPGYTRDIWPNVVNWIRSAVIETNDWWTADDVLDGVKRGQLTLWVIADENDLYGAVVTEIEEAPRHRIGVIALCAGEAQEKWLHLLPELEDWAKAMGCSEMQVRGRPGWVRRLKSQGYSARYIAVGKGLQ